VGQEGEIIVRSPHVMKGYWKRPEETDQSFLPGKWFRTGDLGWVDNTGHITLTGRIKLIIKVKGRYVNLLEVESILLNQSQVKDVAVVGISDPAWFRMIGDRHGEMLIGRQSEVLVAYIVLEKGRKIDLSLFRKTLRSELDEFKVPSRFIIIDKLPITGAHEKIDRGLLVDPQWYASNVLGSSPVKNPGGIDLNPQAIEMDKSGSGVDFPVPAFDPTQFQNIEGFIPIIINVSPITNIPLLLGLTETAEEPTDLGFDTLDPLEKRDRFKVDQLSLLN